MTSGKTPAAKQPAPPPTVSQASKKAPPARKKRKDTPGNSPGGPAGQPP
jgi:hypothetical protein